MRYYFIVNPISGSGRGKALFEQARALLDAKGVDYGFCYTERQGHAPELTRAALQSGERCIVAVGGDGTTQEVACVLAGSNAVMGLFPFGTGNDFARAVGIERSVEAAVEALLQCNVQKADAALANDRLFINVAGFGFDVDVVQYTEKYKQKYNGMLPYMLGVLKSLMHLRPLDITITANGNTFTERALLFDACNGTHFAGGMNVAPQASAFDGLLDVCILRALSVPAFLWLLPRFIKGRHLSSRHIAYFKAESVRVESAQGNLLNLDGELGSTTPVTFAALPAALNLIVGKAV